MSNRLNYLIAGCFVALIFLTIIFVTAILPATTFQPEATIAATNYEKLALVGVDLTQVPEADAERARYYRSITRGRNIYRREGCFYCHSQFNRYQDRETGEMVMAGDYIYETPHVLGTERTGPDLSNIGGKYPDAWHVAHHMNPRTVKPGSVMPSYSYLSDQEMTDLVNYLQTIGREREIAARLGILRDFQPEGTPSAELTHSKTETPAEDKGNWQREPITWIEAPVEMRDDWERIGKQVPVNDSAIANSGRGIYMQNCSTCHGVSGRGNGPMSSTMIKKPANFTRPFYAAYKDSMWYWRVKEGVAGTRMPRWGRTLSEQQMAYLVAFLKTLPKDADTPSSEIEVTRFDQLEEPEPMSRNYYEIEHLQELQHENAYIYGGGRH